MLKKLLNYFFVTLGIIFFLILLGLAYLWFADPFGVRPLIATFTNPTTEPQTEQTNTTDKHPTLSEEQEQALESIGVNPEALPSTITPEMEACFTALLGEARVAEIKGGASPSPLEVLKTKECY